MYRAIVHYHFKKGLEEKGIRFLETQLLKRAQEFGCHDIELWASERDPSLIVGMGCWNSLEEARSFQSVWEINEKELLSMCTSAPKREFYRIQKSYSEKTKKVA